MPFLLAHPPERRGGPKWRHPMERFSPWRLELDFVFKVLGWPYSKWIREATPEDKIIAREWQRLDLATESYFNLPKDKRFTFFHQ